MFWVYMSSSEFGGEIFGGYESPEDAAQTVARLALAAYQQDDGIPRSFRIIAADNKRDAEQQIADDGEEVK